MKQGNPTKRFGIIALISAMIAGLTSRPENTSVKDLHQRRSVLLTNGGAAPIPQRLPNQRQRRKSAAQNR